MSARQIDLGTVVRIGSVTTHKAAWTDDGVVIEVVPAQAFPQRLQCRSVDCCLRYVVQTAHRTVVRTAMQMEIIAL